MSSFRDQSNEISRMAQGPNGRWVVAGIVALVVVGLIATAVLELL